MGTRADFYVGRGDNAEWLGSIAFDGYPEGINQNILNCTDEQIYRDFVKLFLEERDDATFPKDGWPWPWNDSRTTDYSYAFDNGNVYQCCFGYFWYPANEPLPDEDEHPELWKSKNVLFPDMSLLKNITLGRRSGLLVISAAQ